MDLICKRYDCYPITNTKMELKNANLWKSFHEIGTEMIITKSGRRMFPNLNVQLYDLDPNASYCVLLEMSSVSHCRFKYSNAGGWAPAGTEEAQSPQRVYLHPDSPATGEYWMSQPASFGRLKLTNTLAPPPGQVVLSSMHKYQPRIIVCKTADSRNMAWAPSVSKAFPETQFIAVTAYQNERITKLKIDNNPFAKGFRENGQAKCKRKRNDIEDEESKQAKHVKVERLLPSQSQDDGTSSSSLSSSPCSSQTIPDCPSEVTRCSPSSYECTNYHPTPTSHSMVYYPYTVYPPVMWGLGAPTAMFHSMGAYSHAQLPTNSFVNVKPLNEKSMGWGVYGPYSPQQTVKIEPPKEVSLRKLTDFSIRAITGNS